MIYRNPNQRVAVLVDVQNLYYSAKNLYNARVSYTNLLKIAVQNRILTRAIAYVIKADPAQKESSFFDAVNSSGFEVKEKDLQVFGNGMMKGDWDLGIAMDAIRLGSKVDSIVLASGDGDYVPVVNYLQQALGCLVEVVAFKQSANRQLVEVVDDFTNLDDYRDSVLFKPRPTTMKPSLNRRPTARPVRSALKPTSTAPTNTTP